MTAFQTISQCSLDQLEGEILSLHQRATAAEYQFLLKVREYDLRQGWKECLCSNCAEWLNYKCGIELSTAREKLRVAHTLWDLPVMSGAFEAGELSYSKVRALTRTATPTTEAALVEFAVPATAQQVIEHCQGLRNANREASTADVNKIHQGRYLCRTSHGDGSMTISMELTQEAGELVMKALEIAAAGQERNDQNLEGGASFQAKQADALVEIARDYLAGGSERTTSTADNYQVVVHAAAVAVDEAALREDCGQASQSDLPVESIKRLCCDSSVVTVIEDERGNPLELGRKRRVVQPAQRRALLARDKCCCVPGCTHGKWLDAHHVEHWIDGGETNLGNLILLCSHHHRLLHEGGFTISKGPDEEWIFRNSRGRVIPQGPIFKLTKSVTNPTRDASGGLATGWM
jgi:hypothetical protein